MKKTTHVRRTIITILAVASAFFILLLGIYQKVIFQEGNPIPLIASIVKLEFTELDSVQYANEPDKHISEFRAGEERYEVLKTAMAADGWIYEEQLGSGLLFSKNNKELMIETRQYTSNYFIWEVP